MKHFLQFVLSMGIGLVAVIPAAGQIVITAVDAGTYFTPGNVSTTRLDTGTHTTDIGTLGSNSWDFSGLTAGMTLFSAPVDPDTTSMIGFYPGATHAIRAGSGYSYYKLATNLEFLGYGQPPPTEIRTKQIPPQVINQLPLTMGSSWTATYAESSYVTISGTTYMSLNNHVAENSVEAYGTLTLPGGAVYQALRLKTDRRSTSSTNSFRFISYQFLTKEGASVNVSPSDTNQPQTGTISISNISWSLPASATSVKEVPGGTLPTGFALDQNYPNPFNPSTTIQFSAVGNAFVSLKVYDLLGRELSTLVAERLAPGRYSVEWDGSAFPTGVYVCRMQSGDYVESRRLVLVR